MGTEKAKETVGDFLESFPEGQEDEEFCELLERYHLSEMTEDEEMDS